MIQCNRNIDRPAWFWNLGLVDGIIIMIMVSCSYAALSFLKEYIAAPVELLSLVLIPILWKIFAHINTTKPRGWLIHKIYEFGFTFPGLPRPPRMQTVYTPVRPVEQKNKETIDVWS